MTNIEYRIDNWYYYQTSFEKGVPLLKAEYVVDTIENISAREANAVFGKNNSAMLGRKALKKLATELNSRYAREHTGFIEITVLENCAGFTHYEAYLKGISDFIRMLTDRYKGESYFICMLTTNCFSGLIEPIGFTTIKLKRSVGCICDSLSVMKIE